MNKADAINCVQDIIDVAKSHGSACVYSRNGGTEQLENVLSCLKSSDEEIKALRNRLGRYERAEKEAGPGPRVTTAGSLTLEGIAAQDPVQGKTADEMFRDLGYRCVESGYEKEYRKTEPNSNEIRICVTIGNNVSMTCEGKPFWMTCEEVKACARLLEEMEMEARLEHGWIEVQGGAAVVTGR